MQNPSVSPGERSTSQAPMSHLNEQQASSRSYQASSSMQYRPRKNDRSAQFAKALGWFSIGLGVAQLVAPRAMSRATGVASHPNLLRAVGVREIASGVGILSQRRPTGWLWMRVAGDAMDLALLGVAAGSPKARRNRIAIAAAAVAGVAALDVLASVRQSEKRSLTSGTLDSGAVYVEKSITINRSADECYRFWRDFENFPSFMAHLESVQNTVGNQSHWKSKAPMGTSVEWDAEVTVDQPGELLAWHSMQGADVENAGTVRFDPAPGGRGTIVRVELQYSPPGGKAGSLMAKLFGQEPGQQIDEDLRRFKWLIETGEIPTTVGQSAGQRSTLSRLLFRKGAPG